MVKKQGRKNKGVCAFSQVPLQPPKEKKCSDYVDLYTSLPSSPAAWCLCVSCHVPEKVASLSQTAWGISSTVKKKKRGERDERQTQLPLPDVAISLSSDLSLINRRWVFIIRLKKAVWFSGRVSEVVLSLFGCFALLHGRLASWQ